MSTGYIESPTTSKQLITFLLRVVIAGMFFAMLLSLPLVLRTTGSVLLASLAVVTFMLMAAPVFLWKDYDVGEPFTMVLLMTIFGISYKLLYVIAFDGRRYHVNEVLLNGDRSSVLNYGTIVAMTGLICFLIGYWRRGKEWSLGRFPLAQFQSWSEGRLLILSVLIIVVSGVFFVLFAKSIGVSLLSVEGLSQKRFIDPADHASQRDYREETLQTSSYYYYRIAAFAKFAFFLNLAWLIHSRKRLLSLQGLITAWSGLQTLAVFFFMNSRASVALVVLVAVVMTYYLKDRIHLWKVATAVGLGCILLLMQLAMRAQQDHSVMELVEKTLVGRDFMDVTKTALIINAVPHSLDYCHGETLLGWLAAPIPQSIWPNKPMWSERGVHINQRVYGAKTTLSGVTLGLIAELYWNFGWMGVCLGMFFVGIVLRILHTWFVPYRHNVSAVAMYSLLVTQLTLFTLGSDLGTGILKTTLDIVPMAICIVLVGKREPTDEEWIDADTEYA